MFYTYVKSFKIPRLVSVIGIFRLIIFYQRGEVNEIN
jgi:hypothetical protein